MKQARTPSIDLLRVFAAAIVVIFHVLASSINNDPLSAPEFHTLLSVFSATMRWSVYLFFIITGYLWLGDGKSCTYPKVWRAVTKFAAVLCTVGFSYALMERFFHTRTISVSLFLNAMSDVATGKLWDHMWYVYAIIGIYLILPVLKPFFERSDLKSIGIFTGLLFASTILFPAIQSATGYAFPIPIPMTDPLFYICAGGLIAKINLTQKKTAFSADVIFCAGVILLFLSSLFDLPLKKYHLLLTACSAVSFFMIISILFANMREYTWMRSLSDCSFGIYLLHPFFINVMIKLLHIYPLRWCPPVSLLLATLGVLGLSYVTTYILRKIPIVRKYIL